MNLLPYYLFARKTTATAPPVEVLPAVSATKTHTRNTETNVMLVTWELLFSKPFTGTVNVRHSGTDDGQPEEWPWPVEVTAEDLTWSGTFSYNLNNMAGLASLTFEALPGTGYTVGAPASVSIDVSAYTGAATGGPVPHAAPTNLTATESNKVVTASWTPNASANQEMELDTNSGGWQFFRSLDAQASSSEFVIANDVATLGIRVKHKGNGTTTLDSPYATTSLTIGGGSTGGYRAKPVPNKNALTFEGPLKLNDALFANSDVVYIRNRNFRSPDPLVGAVNNAVYDFDPGGGRYGAGKRWKIIFEDCVTDASGRHFDVPFCDIDIEVRNCFGFSAGFCTSAWSSKYVVTAGARRVVIENNYTRGIGGPMILVGNGGMTQITHRYNHYHNIAGRTGPTTGTPVNYLNLDGQDLGIGVPNVLSDWDLVTQDESNESWGLEDILNISRFRGTPGSWAKFHNICVYKAYPFPFNATGGWSGSGLMVESPNQADRNKASAFLYFKDCVLLDMGRGAMKFFGCNNTLAEGLRVVYSRKFMNGSERNLYTTGLGGMNYYNKEGTTYNNRFINNYIKWAYGAGGGNPIDYYTPTDGINYDPSNPGWHNTPEVEYINTTIDPEAATLADTLREFNAWKARRDAAGVISGPKERIVI